MNRQISVQPRPYVMSFAHSRKVFPLSTVEAQRVIDASSGTVTMIGPDKVAIEAAGVTAYIQPGTRGGGPAFVAW